MKMAIRLLKDWGEADGQEPQFASECRKAVKVLQLHELEAFRETIPESALPHLSEADIEREYRHHYGEP